MFPRYRSADRICDRIYQNYKDALAPANELEQSAIVRFGQNSRCYAGALAERATILQLLNRDVEAEPIFKNALTLARQSLNLMTPDLRSHSITTTASTCFGCAVTRTLRNLR